MAFLRPARTGFRIAISSSPGPTTVTRPDCSAAITPSASKTPSKSPSRIRSDIIVTLTRTTWADCCWSGEVTATALETVPNLNPACKSTSESRASSSSVSDRSITLPCSRSTSTESATTPARNSSCFDTLYAQYAHFIPSTLRSYSSCSANALVANDALSSTKDIRNFTAFSTYQLLRIDPVLSAFFPINALDDRATVFTCCALVDKKP